MGIESILKEIGRENNCSVEEIPFSIHKIHLNQNEVLTNYGQIETKGYFLTKGIIQCSIIKNGNERITDFIFPDSFFAAFNSFVLDTPSEMKVMALTPCEAEYFIKSEVKKRQHDSLLANHLGRHIKEKIIVDKLLREKQLLTNSPEENYRELILNKPEVIEHIPVNKIAKYLGIHPESLSRIRARIIS